MTLRIAKTALKLSNTLRNNLSVTTAVKCHYKLLFVSRNVKIDVETVKTVSKQSNCLNIVKNDVTVHSACLTNVKITNFV